VAGYYSMTRSLLLIPPTTVAVLRAMEIILAYVAQVHKPSHIILSVVFFKSQLSIFKSILFSCSRFFSFFKIVDALLAR
jgi:hypothetical protein